MELRILPGNIANMIAAGEVVQRPASVVKELMENSVDAGAGRVSVVVLDSGRTLIQVTDNGSGMTPDEAVLCFERHATSKIASAEDLDGITTFGFRGEALASIAAVAEVVLKTRTADSETGCEVCFAASEQTGAVETAAPIGTSISVRNLFYNVPARRKFLKSDNVEFKHIVEEFTKVALTRPQMGFRLNHNGKDIFVLSPAKSQKFRILDLMGSSVATDIVDVSTDTSVVRMRGFIGKPQTARKTVGNQYFFVNGRYFRSPYLHKAVMNAYEGLITEGATPAYFIYLETDPSSIDVNISPTKNEVKFEDEAFVFQVVFAAVKEAIGKNSFIGGIDFTNPEEKSIPVMNSHFSEYAPPTAPRVNLDYSYNPFDDSGGRAEALSFEDFETKGEIGPESLERSGGSPATGGYVDKRDDYGKLFEDQTLPTAQTIVLQGRHIISPTKSGIMVVDIRRARERIFFDRALTALSQNGHVTQSMLFPVRIQVGAAARTLFDDNSSLLSSLGFDITPYGTDSIVVNGVPEGFSGEEGKVRTMVSDLMLILSDDSKSLPGTLEASLAEKFALLGVSYNEPLSSPAEARRLLDCLLSCANPEITSNGRRIIAIMTTQQIEKLF